jgi:hypothetical protein
VIVGGVWFGRPASGSPAADGRGGVYRGSRSALSGTSIARLTVANGYDVVISNSRGPETLSELVAELSRTETSANDPVRPQADVDRSPNRASNRGRADILAIRGSSGWDRPRSRPLGQQKAVAII